MAEATKKKIRKPTGPKSNIDIKNITKIDKKMPEYTGKGAKYAFLTSMSAGECVCLPPGSFNVSPDVLKRAIQGAARRFNTKIVCAMEPEGFCIWRKA